MTVALSLASARAEVLSWLDPGHAPAIVSADYIPGAAVDAHSGASNDGTGWFLDGSTGVRDMHTLAHGIPPALVRVVADTAPLAASLLDAGFAEEVFGKRVVEPGDARPRIVVLFDAATGERLSAGPVDPQDDRRDGAPLAAPTAAILVRATLDPPTATRTRRPPESRATAEPVTPPDAPALDAATVPDPLRPVFDAYPLLPGSTWTWETVSLESGVRWRRSRMRERVTGAWRLGVDQAIVRSRVERWTVFPTEGEAERLDVGGVSSAWAEDVWRHVAADGLVSSHPPQWPFAPPPTPRSTIGLADPTPAMAPDSSRWTDPIARGVARGGGPLGLPLEPLVHPYSETYWSWPEHIYTDRVTVTTPAGTFDGCGIFRVIGGSGWGSVRAICPGVGYAETDSWWVQSMLGSGREVTRLVAYDVVRPR